MQDNFSGRNAGLESPATRGFAITPEDGVDLQETTRGLYVGTGGDLALVLASGDAVTLANVGAGTILPVRALGVKATGTTAAQIVGLA